MASKFDESDFVDGDFVAAHQSLFPSAAPATPAATPNPMNRPPSREEIESKVNETQARLAQLKQEQEGLERERATLEEARRQRIEFQNGRQEMLDHLTRGVGLLTEAEFSARRDAEQMAKTVADLRDALAKVEGMREENWPDANWRQELTRALTVLENARMEWNSARLKWTLLDGTLEKNPANDPAALPLLAPRSFSDWCRIGFALTWPVAAAGLLGTLVIIVLLLRR